MPDAIRWEAGGTYTAASPSAFSARSTIRPFGAAARHIHPARLAAIAPTVLGPIKRFIRTLQRLVQIVAGIERCHSHREAQLTARQAGVRRFGTGEGFT